VGEDRLVMVWPVLWEVVVAVDIEVCVSIEKVRGLSVTGESRKPPGWWRFLGPRTGDWRSTHPLGLPARKAESGAQKCWTRKRSRRVLSAGQRGRVPTTNASPAATAPVGPLALGGAGMGTDRLDGCQPPDPI
jgi:hypothetical protein